MQRFNRGQELTAAQLNQIIDAVRANTPQSGHGNLVSGGGRGGYTMQSVEGVQAPEEGASEVPFRPFFAYTGSGIACSIIASQIIKNGINVIPTFEGTPIYDPSDWEAEPPSKTLTDDSYKMWLEVAGTGAKITVETSDPTKEEGKSYYKLADFVIDSGELKTIYLHSETGLTIDKLSLPWVPEFFKDAQGDVKFTITKGQVLDCMLGTYSTPTLDADYTPETDTKYYCKVTTSPNGAVTATEVITGDDPTNTQHSLIDGVNGEYNFKLFEIKGDATDGFYAIQSQSSTINWHTRDLKNVGGETELVSQLDSAANANEIKSLKGIEGESVGEDWQDCTSTVLLTDNGDTVDITVNTKAPPKYEPDGITGYMTLTQDGTAVATLTFTDGLLTGIADEFGSQPALVLEVCCIDTTIPA